MGLISFLQRLFSSPQERPTERVPDSLPEPASPEPEPEPAPEAAPELAPEAAPVPAPVPVPETVSQPTEDTSRARTSRSSPSAVRFYFFLVLLVCSNVYHESTEANANSI